MPVVQMFSVKVGRISCRSLHLFGPTVLTLVHRVKVDRMFS